MKRIYVFLSIVGIFFQSCDSNLPVSVDENLFLQNSNQSMIEAAEKSLGKLVKVEKSYTDEKTGSVFRLEFAATSLNKINSFLLNHKVEFNGINQTEKEELIKKMSDSKPLKDVFKSQSSSIDDDDFSFDEVFYDLKEKTLKGGAVGYSFALKPLKRTASLIQGSNFRPNGLGWCQQTSLPWCEYAVIAMVTDPSPSDYSLYQQSRGIFWSGSGNSIGTVTTGGNQYNAYVDGPKFTRFGGYDPVADKIDFVIWYDVESNSSTIAY